ncbi:MULTISPECIES: LysM peptidoglycan-binding domain-containing protein [unclassified Meridianimarinicoccus]|uniref:LysM peptidoglycan-binding domain-containing protein n=1 Tax=unclassified Meridianimarinicoccus TaxID=2923344 RepID=UPI001866DE56|nr:LysM peptidoglycan-binding domain-containing protein [Fluviibacterium sp. MJW13]
MDHRPAEQTRHRWPLWLAAAVGLGAGGLLVSGVFPQLEAPETEVAAIPPQSGVDAVPNDPARTLSQGEPSFDLVRVEPDGTTVVAGQARPNARVAVVLDGQTMAETRADASGSFVVFVALEAGDEPRVMWLMAETAEGDMLASVDTVLIAPAQHSLDAGTTLAGTLAQRPAEDLSVQTGQTDPRVRIDQPMDLASLPNGDAVPEVGSAPDVVPQAVNENAQPETSPETSPQAQATFGAVGESSPAETTPPPATERAPAPPKAAPRVLLSSREGIAALDVPRLDAATALRIDTIDYGTDDTVVLKGRAGASGPVRVRLNGTLRGTGTVTEDGLWSLVISDVAPGLYDLRVESLDPSGAVLGQADVPFRREAPGIVQQALNGSGARIVTVQPGATLWAIAQDLYGAGTRYVQVFEANRDQIRDPNLIYPGQVFDLPATSGQP